MGRLTLWLALTLFVVVGTGCQHLGSRRAAGSAGGCMTCPPGSGGGGFGLGGNRAAGGSAPVEYAGRGQGLPADVMGTGATHTVNYPYYTLRGPRDYLAKHPPSIGP